MVKKSSIGTDKLAITHFLTRAVENVYPTTDKLKNLLESGTQIKAYLGIDPTGPSLHMGHVIAIRKLAELQKLGHKIILLIGDFTAMIGDPTDKMAVRKQLTRKEVLRNCKIYKKQASVFLSFSGKNPAELKFNSSWLAKMSFNDVVELASHFTVQQMSERDMFEERMKEGKPVYLHEFMYPLMQGYDSVKLDVDLEIGGNDQTFNMLAGRTLLRAMKQKEKNVLTLKLLADSTGKKMGKSEGNAILMTDAPEEMYGKVMSWTDGMILPAFEVLTDVSLSEIQDMNIKIAGGENPMVYKLRLAKLIVSQLISEKAGETAEKHFAHVHQQGERPEEMFELRVQGSMKLVDVLISAKCVSSKTDARRQIEQGGVKMNDVIIKDIHTMVEKGDIVQKGKRHFVKLI